MFPLSMMSETINNKLQNNTPMNTLPDNDSPTGNEIELARERTKQAIAAAWVAGLCAVAAIWHLNGQNSWPAVAGVTAALAMVGCVCHRILSR